jgi:Skp family chaperone for outer membrane proteins
MKRLLLYGLTLLLVFQVGAQDGNRLGALKIAYLTKKLDLSPEEAQRFWPIYNKYDEEIHTVRINAVKDRTPEIELEEKILNIRKKYSADFGKALSPEKVNTFFRAEKEFGNFVQKEIERRQLKMQQRRSLIRP